MRTLYIILFSLILLPNLLNAQEVAVDPKAKALLDKATSEFSSKSGLITDFTILLENSRDNKSETISGRLYLKGDKFKLDIKDMETYFNGKIQSVYMKDVNEVTISEPQADEIQEINPLMLIKSYQTGYKMRFLETKQIGGKLLDIVDLYPDDLKSNYARITICIEKNSMRMHSLRMQGKDGINTVVTLTKYNYTPLADNVFTLDTSKIKDVEVIDLR